MTECATEKEVFNFQLGSNAQLSYVSGTGITLRSSIAAMQSCAQVIVSQMKFAHYIYTGHFKSELEESLKQFESHTNNHLNSKTHWNSQKTLPDCLSDTVCVPSRSLVGGSESRSARH